jgi:hypothetical protein
MIVRIFRYTLFLLLFLGPLVAMAADVDKDGLSDSVEASLGSSDFHNFTGGFVGGGVSATAVPRETSLDCLTFKEHALHSKNLDVNTPRVTMKEIIEKFRKATEKK